MKFSLKCKVDSSIVIDREIRVKEKSKEFVLIPNEQGILNSIKIIADVPNPEDFYSTIEKGTGNLKAVIKINRDKELYRNLICDFQNLESTLSFIAAMNISNLRKIYWEEPVEKLILESDEERKNVGVGGIHYKKKYSEMPLLLDEKTMSDIIRDMVKYESLTIPKSFYREGNNEFQSFRYINAFYNFYFVIEGFYYKRGKTKDREIAKNFKGSSEFRDIVKWVMEKIEKDAHRHFNNIQELLKEENLKYNVGELIDLVVKVRGNLHHYFTKSTKRQGTPFNQKDFESIAFFTKILAFMAIGQKEIANK